MRPGDNFSQSSLLARLRRRITALFNAGELAEAHAALQKRYLELEQKIAERHQTEAALKASQATLQTILNSITDYVWSADIIEGRVVYNYYSAVVEEITGYPPDYFMSGVERWLNIIHPEDRPLAEQKLGQELTGKTVTHEYRIIRPNGDIKWLYGTTSPTVDETGRVVSLVGIVADITERKQAEEALKKSTLRLKELAAEQRILLEHTRDFVYRHNTEGQFTYLSPSVQQITGYTIEEWQNLHYTDPLTDNPINQQVVIHTERTLQTGQESPPYLAEILHKNGQKVMLEIKERPYFEDHRVAGIVGVARDVTDRQKAEAKLEEERNLLRTLIDNLPDHIYVIDEQGRHILANAVHLQFIGVSLNDVIGKTVFDLYPPEVAGKYHAENQHVLQTGLPTFNREDLVIDAQGNRRWFLVSEIPLRDVQGKIVGLLGISRDITEHKRLEEQLLQAQKMEAVGTLAGGIAHDFNNMLTAIMGYADLILTILPADHPAHNDTQTIKRLSERAAGLTRQLLTFARQQAIEPTELNLNNLILDLKERLQRILGHKIDMVTQLQPSLAQAKVDPYQIEQIMINLVTNAQEAMPNGGKLTLTTANVTISQTQQEQTAIPAGDYVLLCIEDSGIGIDDEIKPHIFEPFFTTKEVGQGPGLGLATAFGIIKQSNGHIQVESQPWQGTRISIYLPQIAATPNIDPPAVDIPKLPLPGKETILLVEDDPSIRYLTSRMLSHEGYNVIEAANGNEALKLAQTHRNIDLVITDVIMPQMGGKTLVVRLRAMQPEVKVLFISGWVDNHLGPDTLEEGIDFLQKPFTPAALTGKVEQMLAKSNPAFNED